MNLQSPPEIADGGYWYVVPEYIEPDTGGQSPGNIPGGGWCAWYANGLVAVRTPEPVVGLATASEPAVSAILAAAGYTGKPYGRVGGS